jgi:hypothetical protein
MHLKPMHTVPHDANFQPTKYDWSLCVATCCGIYVYGRMKRIRKVLIFAFVIMAAAFFLLLSFQLMDGAALVVCNNTKVPMKGVSIELIGYGTTGNLGDIPPGGQLRTKFKSYGDSCWVLTVDDFGGKQLHKQDGYVTNGLNYSDRITLEASGEWLFDSTDWTLIPPLSAFLP